MRRLPGIDALRGVAVLLVMGRHAVPGLLPGAGVVGVVMFFTLSGYLITGILEQGLDPTGPRRRWDALRRFYLGRLVRLVPALVTVLVGLTLVTLVVDPLGDRDQLLRTWLFALTWTGDLPFGHASPATFHLWTLALEEQFYLLWPWVLILGARWARPRLVLVLSAGACLLAALGTTIWLRSDVDLGYSLPTSWAVCFVIGAAARHLRPRDPRDPRVLAAVAALVTLSLLEVRGHLGTYVLVAPTIALATAVLLVALRDIDRTSTVVRALAWLGVLSYGAYLWNYPLTLWVRPESALAAGTLVPLGTIILAWTSHRWIETPLQRLGRNRLRVGR